MKGFALLSMGELLLTIVGVFRQASYTCSWAEMEDLICLISYLTSTVTVYVMSGRSFILNTLLLDMLYLGG